MTLSQSFAALFADMNMLTVCLWITGVILICTEFFQPMHNAAYILGLSLTVSAFVTRMIYGSAGVAFMFVFITVVLIYAVHVVSLVTQKRDWLLVARMQKAGERSKKYGSLIGGIGVATTPIDLSGSVTINDINLVVHSDTPIAAGERVTITGISYDKITVERADITDEQPLD